MRKNHFFILAVLICGMANAQTGATIQDSILSNGIYRTFTLYVPKSYTVNNVPVPLIVNMHGLTGSGNQQLQYADFRYIADTANFIVVLPNARTMNVSLGGFPITAPSWDVLTPTVAAGDTDRTFILNLVDTIKTRYQINSNRVYSTGFSEGACMSYAMAAFNNQTFAAIAAVSGAMDTSYFFACKPTRPTPVMEVHGTLDQLFTYTGSTSFTAVDSLLKCWRNFNRCPQTPTVDTALPNINPSDTSHVQHYVWSGGTQGVSVELYKVIGGGHAWPSLVSTGGTTSPCCGNPMSIGDRNMDFSASQVIWRFFSQYTLTTTVTSTGPFDILTMPQPFKPTGIETLAANDNITVYPNPSTGTVTLYVENVGSIGNASIQILNVLDETVYEQKISAEYTVLKLGNLENGVYSYAIKNQLGIIKNGKLVVQQ